MERKQTGQMGYRYEKYNKNDICVTLPEKVSGQPVTIIGAKAFLSCRQVEQLVLPDTLEQVEDWAFAHMKGLKEILLPAKNICFGRKVFLGCDSLMKVTLTHQGLPIQGQYRGIPYFIASVFRLSLETIEKGLTELERAGDAEGQWRWLAVYDEALTVYLGRPDDYDFEPAFIGWFDVEDVDDQKQGHMAEQIKKKIALAFQRLRYPKGLSEDTGKLLGDYLVKKVPGQVLELMREPCSEYGREVAYFKIWQQVGGFDVFSPKKLLEQLEEADPEVRGFLMECELEDKEREDFFGGLEL